MPLMVTWHPTFAFFHAPYEWGAFETDLNRFARLIRGELEAPPILITSPTANDMARMAAETTIAVDVETAPATPAEPWSGKDPTRAKLKTIAFGTETWALSFAWQSDAKLRSVAKRILADASVTKVFMNGWHFDIPVLERHGCKVR